MTISALPPITYPINKTLFPGEVDAFIPALATFVTEVNATAAAMNLNSINDTSASSVLIGTGSKSFTVSASKSFSPGMWLSIADTAAPTTNSMVAQVTSYIGTALVVNVPANGIRGSGTKTAWTITLTAAPSTDVAATFLPVSSAANLADSRTALDVYNKAETLASVAGGANLKSIDYTLAANALTLKLNPTTLSFRSATLTDGAPVSVSNVAQLTTTISSGSTGGTVSAVQSDIVLLAINNAGTMELAWTNLAGGAKLDETNLITTVAEGGAGAADSATTIYSTTARTNVAYKVVGIFRSTQTVAGTWAQAPALVQGIGGQALAALSSFGYGQTWQSLLGSRVSGTTYYNTTGKPIMVSVTGTAISTGWSMQAYVNGLQVYECYYYDAAYTHQDTVDLVVPPGHSYSVTNGGGFVRWVELR